MADSDQPDPPQEIVDYVGEHAPELDPGEVAAFVQAHDKPDDEPGTQLAWAVRVMRQRGEGEFGQGLPVERVVEQFRRLDD